MDRATTRRSIVGHFHTELERRMKAAGHNAHSLAKAAGLESHGVSEILAPRRGGGGDARISTVVMIATELGCSLDELAGVARPLGLAGLPIRYNVSGAFTLPAGQDHVCRPPLVETPAPDDIAREEGAFAVNVLDASADNLGYPPGALLACRTLMPEEPLHLRTPVVARFRRGPERAETHEVLVGIIDKTGAGEIVLTTRSSDSEIPGTSTIQSFGERGAFAEITPQFPRQEMIVTYTMRADDPGEILGIVLGVLKGAELLRRNPTNLQAAG